MARSPGSFYCGTHRPLDEGGWGAMVCSVCGVYDVVCGVWGVIVCVVCVIMMMITR